MNIFIWTSNWDGTNRKESPFQQWIIKKTTEGISNQKNENPEKVLYLAYYLNRFMGELQ